MTAKVTTVKKFSRALQVLLNVRQFETVVAIGKKAKGSLDYLEHKSSYVRHPGHGGKRRFQLGIERIFEAKREGS